MKKFILPALLAAMTICTLTGCNVTTTSTKTETVTDADGNTTTTTTVKENGKTTTTTETTTAEEAAAEEPVRYTATLAFENSADFDIAELHFAAGSDDNWGDDILGEYAPLKSGETLTFHECFNYSENNLLWDLLAYDEEGASVEFEGLDMSCAADPENITILLEYDEAEQGYTVMVQ